MSFNYAKMATLAETLLTKFGQSMTLTRVGTDGYDTGEGSSIRQTADEAVIGVILPTGSATVASAGSIGDFDNSVVGTDLVDSRRRFAILKAKGTSPPEISDLLEVGSDIYRVTGVTAVSPAGTAIIYRVGLEAA